MHTHNKCVIQTRTHTYTQYVCYPGTHTHIHTICVLSRHAHTYTQYVCYPDTHTHTHMSTMVTMGCNL